MNRLPSAGHARRDAANGASLLAWGVAFAVLAVPSVGTAVFPVDSFAGAAAWLAWYHLLFFWGAISAYGPTLIPHLCAQPAPPQNPTSLGPRSLLATSRSGHRQ